MKYYEIRKKGLNGQDVNLEVSLKEYGIAWKVKKNETIFYFGIEQDKEGNYISFDISSFKNETDVFQEFSWVDWESIFSFVGMTKEKWFSLSLPQKIVDLFNYYGRMEIFGSYC